MQAGLCERGRVETRRSNRAADRWVTDSLVRGAADEANLQVGWGGVG